MALKIASNKPRNRVISKSQIVQRIDFEEFFGVDLSSHRGLKLAIGQALLDRILERTADGIDVNGDKFPKYSDAYKKSLPFKAWGKSAGDVNLELTGQMLGTLDFINEGSNDLTLGWDNEEQILKAYNHITGDTVPKRDFFGANQADIDAVAKQFEGELSRVRQNREEETQERRAAVTDALAIFEAYESLSGSRENDLLGELLRGQS